MHADHLVHRAAVIDFGVGLFADGGDGDGEALRARRIQQKKKGKRPFPAIRPKPARNPSPHVKRLLAATFAYHKPESLMVRFWSR